MLQGYKDAKHLYKLGTAWDIALNLVGFSGCQDWQDWKPQQIHPFPLPRFFEYI